MQANAKIVMKDGKATYKFFSSIKEVTEWMKANHGKYEFVETDFLNPWTIEESKPEKKVKNIYA